MNSKLIGIIASILVVSMVAVVGLVIIFSPANINAQPQRITYICNCGFLIEGGGKRIVLDGVFDYSSIATITDGPSTEDQGKLIYAKAPYETIDLLAVTHGDADHFNTYFSTSFLKSHSMAKFISTSVTCDYLNSTGDYDLIKDRIISSPYALNTTVTYAHNGITIKPLSCRHPYGCGSPVPVNATSSDIQNFGYLITIGSIKIFHSGDTDLNYFSDLAFHQLAQEDIDIAFLPAYWLGWNGTTNQRGIDLVRNYINPQKIVLMHMQQSDMAYYCQLADDLASQLSIMVFQTPLESQSY